MQIKLLHLDCTQQTIKMNYSTLIVLFALMMVSTFTLTNASAPTTMDSSISTNTTVAVPSSVHFKFINDLLDLNKDESLKFKIKTLKIIKATLENITGPVPELIYFRLNILEKEIAEMAVQNNKNLKFWNIFLWEVLHLILCFVSYLMLYFRV